MSSLVVEGAPGSDVATLLVRAIDSLDRDLWPAVSGWGLDYEASEEHYHTVGRAWKARWPSLAV